MDNDAAKTPFSPATITVLLEPECVTKDIPRPKTVTQLLNKLGIRQGEALVARNGELLTPDRRIETGDSILVRKVISRG